MKPRIILQTEKISKKFGSFLCLSDVSFTIDSENRLVIIAGENGTGKTSLLNIICGLTQPDHGNLHFKGQNARRKNLPWFTNHGMVRLFQAPRAFEQSSVLDCLLFSHYGEKLPGTLSCLFRPPSYRQFEDKAVERAISFLHRIGWDDKATTLAGELSFGQRKLLALGTALLSNGDFLVLDEPVAGLDRKQIQLAVRLIKQWTDDQDQRAALVVTHELQAFQGEASQVLRLQNGGIKKNDDA